MIKRPSWIPSIDWSKSLTKDLIFLPWGLPSGHVIDLVTGEVGAVVAGTVVGGVVGGREVATVNGGDRLTFTSTLRPDIGSGPYTCLCNYSYDGSAASWQTVIAQIGNDLGMYLPRSGSSRYMSADGTGGQITVNWSNVTVTENEYHTYAYSIVGSGNTASGYLDGLYIEESSGTINYNGSGGLRLFYGQGSEDAHGSLFLGAVWKRELTAVEHLIVHNELFDVFVRQPAHPVWLPVAAVGGVTLLRRRNPLQTHLRM